MAPTPEQIRTSYATTQRSAEREEYNKTQEEWAKSLFNAQAYLMTFIPELAARYDADTLTTDNHPWSRIVQSTDPESVVNRLTVNSNTLAFSEGENINYSQLIPHIAIYKVFNDGAGNQEEVLYPFANQTDFSFLKPVSSVRQAPGVGRKRSNYSNEEFTHHSTEGGLPGVSPSSLRHMGSEAGIKSVHWKLEGRGRNPYSANIVDITLKMFFQDVKTLFHPLPIPPDSLQKIRDTLYVEFPGLTYSDLIRVPASATRGGSNAAPTVIQNGVYHRIRLELVKIGKYIMKLYFFEFAFDASKIHQISRF